MEKSTSQKIKLGLFVILGTAILMVAVYLIGNRQNLFGGTFEISAVFKNVNGLQEGNNVRFSGIIVGTVHEIEMVNDTTIRVNMLIEEDMSSHIRKNAVAAVGSDGLVGSMIINISPGSGQASLVQDGDEIRAYSRIATEDMLSTLSVTNENAAQLTADLLTITESLINGKGTVARLLNDTGMARDMTLAIANLKGITQEVNSAMGEIRTLLQKVSYEGSPAEVLLSDTAAGRQVKNLIANLQMASGELQHVIKDLDTVVVNVKEGEGAIHYLASDTGFVNNLDATMENLEQGTARFNENMEALKHNFLFRGYFKRKAREAEKRKKAEEED